MRANQARFVTVCQQALALGAVLAVTVPATRVITLDVVTTHPGTSKQHASGPKSWGNPGTPAGNRTDHTDPVQPKQPEQAEVETAPVSADVEKVAMTEAAPTTQKPGVNRRGGTSTGTGTGTREVRSAVETMSGYGGVGVTWGHDNAPVADDQITLSVRTATGGSWGDWEPIEYHDEHGPDGDEEADTRPGTDLLLVGDVDRVQARAVTHGAALPADLELSIVTPGTSHGTTSAKPDLDTSAGDLELSSGTVRTTSTPTKVTTKPQIYSRAQWGANERLRDKGSLRYGEIHAGFVHHTVNANSYSREQVPGMIRSIYAYHTQSRGWSDLGYNFLVDRFGRIWEGRAGGVDRPVIGAHTLGYNDYSFAMSAIGNFETAQPGSAMLDAYGRLFAWKLSLHGIDAADTSQRVGSRTFKAINGHRDAGSTACPGRYLYAKIPTIRTLADRYQADWTGRERMTRVMSGTRPEILLRRTSDKAGYVLPTAGMLRLGAPRSVASGFATRDRALLSGDLTGDGRRDLVVHRAADGKLIVQPGTSAGGFATTGRSWNFSAMDQVSPVGDLSGDGRNDIVARRASTGVLHLYRSTSSGGFSRIRLSASWKGYNLTSGVGDLNGDGKADLVARDTSGRLWFHPGTGRSGLGTRTQLSGTWSGYSDIAGGGDFTGDGRNDLFVRSAGNRYGFVMPVGAGLRLSHWRGPLGAVTKMSSISVGQVSGSAHPDVIGLSAGRLMTAAHAGTQNVTTMKRVGSVFSGANQLLNVGDWDRDGYGDIITRSTAGRIELRRGLSDNTLAAPVTISSNFASVKLLAAVGDMTGDGYPDLMGQPSSGSMRIYPGRGRSGFGPSYVAKSPLSGSGMIGVGRWDADGSPDVMVRSGTQLKLYRGNGPGGLTGSPTTMPGSFAAYDRVIGAGDVDGNGHADLVAREKSTGYLWMLPGTRGGFGTRQFLTEGFAGYDLIG